MEVFILVIFATTCVHCQTAATASAGQSNYVYSVRPAPNFFLPQEVAIICGCLLWLTTILSFTTIGVILKTVKVKGGTKPVIRNAGNAGFYEGLNVNSTQVLVGSTPSFVTSPSDQQLNVRGGNSAVYFNRGFEIEQQGGGTPAGQMVRTDSRA